MAVQPILPKQNQTTVTDRRPSPNIWSDCPWAGIQEASRPGMQFYDDFQDVAWATTTSQLNVVTGRYKIAQNGSSSVISRVSTVNSVEIFGGALQHAIAASADCVTIAQGFPGYMMTGLSSNSGKLWFECCVATNVITNNSQGFFVGLAEVDQWTISNSVPFTSNAGAINNSASAIGWYHKASDLTVARTSYSDRATSFTDVSATAGTLAAFTFTKLGFVYDPTRSSDCVRFYQDNVQTASSMTSTVLTGTTNLSANALGLIFSSYGGSSVSSGLNFMKWWRVCQVFPN